MTMTMRTTRKMAMLGNKLRRRNADWNFEPF